MPYVPGHTATQDEKKQRWITQYFKRGYGKKNGKINLVHSVEGNEMNAIAIL